MRILVGAALSAALIITPSAVQAANTPAKVMPAVVYKKYSTCKSLNNVYPHGVGRKGAVDRTSGKRVRNFYVNTKLYKLNSTRDRDKDGVACGKA